MAAKSAEQVNESFAKFFNAADLDGLASLYEPGASLVYQPDGATARGTAAIREALKGFLATKAKLTMNIKRVVRSGEDLAVLYNDWQLEGIATSGKAVEIVRRQADGTWLYSIDDAFGRG